jgi:galactose mutarotase-like enzyme
MMTPLETLELESERTHVVLAPERGGMVTRLAVEGRELLYLDESTLVDRSKNVRGGNPVLFPSPGPLAGDRFSWRGKTGAMKQHGFARQRAWRVIERDATSATLELASDDATRAEFPWDFAFTQRHVAKRGGVRIEQRVENRSTDAMPFALGFHPYFVVADAEKKRARIETNATRAFDNVTKKEIVIEGPIDLTAKEVDLHLVDHGRSSATLHLPGGDRIVVSGSQDYRRWVVWTLAGKDFVCLEPWTAAANALNDEQSLTVLAAGAVHEAWIEIARDA